MNLKRFKVTFQTFVLNPDEDSTNTIESLYASSDDAPMYPEEGITVFYGKRFGSQSLSKASREATRSGDKLLPVTIEMEAWRPETSAHWFDDMEGKTVFDLRRLNKQCKVEDLIIGYFSKYMKDDGFSDAAITNRAHSVKDDFNEFPSYLDRLRKEPEFSHVNAFVWQTIEDNEVAVRATIYNTDPVTSVKPMGSNRIKVALPKLKKHTKAA